MTTQHNKDDYNILDGINASLELSFEFTRSKFPSEERDARNVFAAIRDDLMLDDNSRQNLATFCQTWVDGKIRQLMNLSNLEGQIIAKYYNFLRLVRKGYAKIHNACYEIARPLTTEIGNTAPLEIIFDGNSETGILALISKLKEDKAFGRYTLHDLIDRLHSRGWQVSAHIPSWRTRHLTTN